MTALEPGFEPFPYRNVPVAEAMRPFAKQEGQGAVLRQWVAILLRWRWAILSIIGLSLLTAIVVTFLMTRMYTASVSLEISRESGNVIGIEGVEPKGTGTIDQEFYQTQYGLLRSRTLAEAVVKELKLEDSRQFFQMFDATKALGPDADAPSMPLPASRRADRVRAAAKILLDHFSVDPLRASRLVTIDFESPDPEFSARVANVWAEKFIAQNLERRFDATAYARKFLESRLEQVRERLEASERALVGYASSNRLITVGSPTDNKENRSQERSIVTDSLVALNEQLAEARAARIAAESRTQGSNGATSESLTSQTLATLRQRRTDVSAERQRLLAQFKPDYPGVVALTSQLREIDAGIAREEARIGSTLNNQYHQAITREQALSNSVRTLETQVLEQRRRGIQYNIFQRDVDTNRQLYDALLQRYKEIGVAGGIGSNNVAIVDQALAPIKPSKPRPLLNLILALFAGTALGIAAAFALEQIDEALSDTTDVESKLGLAALGAVPKLPGDIDPLQELRDRKSSLSEAYLSVATALRFSTADGMPPTLLLTSTRPAEGKSTSSVAIAITLARLGYRTLLVDADMRSPSLHSMLDVKNEAGLSNVLVGEPLSDELLRPLDVPNLTLLPAGPMPPNPAELLSGSHFEEMLNAVAKHFDVVVLDGPPVMGLADAPVMASKAAATLMVVEARGTRSRQAQLAIKRLNSTQARLLGVILTKFDVQRAHYGYGYDYGYGYGHTEDRAKPDDAAA